MAQTVIAAFNEFLADKVNLDPEDTKSARASRDWLFERVASFQSDSTFPRSYSEHDNHYGSFARRTKVRPLDDIDLMICLHAQGGSYADYGGPISITVNPESNLKAFCNDYTNTLNSTKVINKFVAKCADVPQYSKAEIKRNGVAAVLSLKSYDWAFDIVPCFMTVVESNGRNYYLIPDGQGTWKKTDPRIDRTRAQTLNQTHDGHLLDVVRVIKYWNKRPTMPSMSSYVLETMVLDYYTTRSDADKASQFVDLEFPRVLEYIASHIYSQVNDPKSIQGDINNLSWDERTKISSRATADKQEALEARRLENAGDQKGSIQHWQKVFGGEFPAYE
jgi:hypothetical protein